MRAFYMDRTVSDKGVWNLQYVLEWIKHVSRRMSRNGKKFPDFPRRQDLKTIEQTLRTIPALKNEIHKVSFTKETDSVPQKPSAKSRVSSKKVAKPGTARASQRPSAKPKAPSKPSAKPKTNTRQPPKGPSTKPSGKPTRQTSGKSSRQSSAKAPPKSYGKSQSGTKTSPPKPSDRQKTGRTWASAVWGPPPPKFSRRRLGGTQSSRRARTNRLCRSENL